jgi:hypothetical protein
LDKGLKLLLNGKGQEFVEYYYEYLEKIVSMKIPLKLIASRAKVKLTLDDYRVRCTQKTKAGSLMSRMAHMELAIRDGLNVNLGDVIYYVNNGTRASHGDVQKKTDSLVINCYRLDNEELEKNPDLTGEYNVPRAVVTFNKRLEPLMVVFKDDVRNTLLVDDPSKREFFTKEQCELVNGYPLGDGDQDRLFEDVLEISPDELKYWKKRGLEPDYIYELAEEGWSESLTEFQTV